MNDRATVSSWTPAEIAERDSDLPARIADCSDHRTTDALWEVLTDPNALKDFLEDSELAGPLSEMVSILPKCIKEIADNNLKYPEYQAMLRLVAQVERVLVSYVEGE